MKPFSVLWKDALEYGKRIWDDAFHNVDSSEALKAKAAQMSDAKAAQLKKYDKKQD